MGTRFHGLFSIGLVVMAVALAAVTALLTSSVLGLGYLALSALALLGIFYAFCAKCPCRLSCGHVLPGMLASRFVSCEPGPYSKVETAIVMAALLLLLGLPQAWLWRYPILLIAFWLSAIVAVIEIRSFVCRACDNTFCPAASQGSGLSGS